MSLGMSLYLIVVTVLIVGGLVAAFSVLKAKVNWWEFETNDLVFEMENGDSIQGSAYRRTWLNYYVVNAYAYDSSGNAHQMIGQRVKLPRNKVAYVQAVAERNGPHKVQR